jgi:hypothetical protein
LEQRRRNRMHLQDKLIHTANNLCLAIDYLYAGFHSIADEAERNPEFIEIAVATVLISGLIEDREVLDESGFVNDAEKLLYKATSHKFNVTKRNITSIKELPLDKYVVVNYEFNNHNHWVLFYGQTLLYNPMEQSVCYKYGKPTECRIIEKQL